MALVVGEWGFPAETSPPALADIAAALGRSMGLAALVEGTGRDATLRVPALGEQLFDWRAEPGRLRLHGFAPAHPYLWEHLDAALTAAGGRASGGPTAWRPDPRRGALRRPWSALSRRDQWILRAPAILLARPLDRFLGSTPR
jgi:hypothetical protein